MKERPILFSGPMVRAILDGCKTQTRRIVKPQPEEGMVLCGPELYAPTRVDRHGDEYPGEDVFGVYSDDGEWGVKCPYGIPGDRLWVRETWRVIGGREYEYQERIEDVKYRANLLDVLESGNAQWRPSIFMPRWACRIELEITEIRVQRLQEISEEDAKAEGAAFQDGRGIGHSGWRHDFKDVYADARSSFVHLWESINGAGSWDANPWVWAVSFRRIHAS